MKKLIYLTLFLIVGVLLNCKKDSEIAVVAPVPEPANVTLTKAAEFLKGISVAGAEKIEFDSAVNCYLVTFPDSYNESEAEVKVSLQEDIALWNNEQSSTTPDSIIKFRYQGVGPLFIKVSDGLEKNTFHFNVYFNFSGTPQIDLLSKDIPISATGSILPIRYLAKVGSIPSSPTQHNPVVKIINRKTGLITENIMYGDNFFVNFEDAHRLITDDPLAMEIRFYNQKPVVFEGIRFIRDVPVANVTPDYKFEYARKDTIKVNGGFFLPTAKYSVTFASDFLSAPVTKSIRFSNSSLLTLDNIPADLPEGPYQLSFYENDKLLGKGSIYQSNLESEAVTSLWSSKTNAIENIWNGYIDHAIYRNANALSYKKGDVFFARTLPLVTGSFDTAKQPNLRLKRGGETVELKPIVQVFHWGIAGLSFAVGKYTIPANIASGDYEVTSISVADGKESKPYWSKIEIR